MKREQAQKGDAGEGVNVEPSQVVNNGGWLSCPKNKGQYDGKNQPWRE